MKNILTEPSTVAFNKLYLFNLLNVSGSNNSNVKFNSYHEAKQTDPYLTKLVEKLTPVEVNMLINRIENIM